MKNHFLITLCLFLIAPLGVSANPIKNKNLNPEVQEPLVPGSRVPLSKMNTAPTPTPSDKNLSEDFRGTLKSEKLPRQRQKQPKMKKTKR